MAVKIRSLTIVDHCTLAYNGAVLALVLLLHGLIPSWHLLALPNLIAIAVILLLARTVDDTAPLIPRLVRNLAPLGFFLPLYVQVGGLNRILFPYALDPMFEGIEETIFGCQPSLAFSLRFPATWLSEYMHFAYASYYVLFPGLALFLYLRRGQPEFLDYMFSLCATMYVCLLIFILLPVSGPLGPAPAPPPDGASLPFSAAMAWIYRHFEIEGGAFPSSHVAVAAVVLYYTVRYARPAACLVGALVASLITATVYCRYHYVIDVLAGLATAAALIPLWRRINPALRRG